MADSTETRRRELRALAKAQCKQADQLVAGLFLQQSIETELEVQGVLGPADFVEVLEDESGNIRVSVSKSGLVETETAVERVESSVRGEGQTKDAPSKDAGGMPGVPDETVPNPFQTETEERGATGRVARIFRSTAEVEMSVSAGGHAHSEKTQQRVVPLAGRSASQLIGSENFFIWISRVGTKATITIQPKNDIEVQQIAVASDEQLDAVVSLSNVAISEVAISSLPDKWQFFLRIFIEAGEVTEHVGLLVRFVQETK